MAEPLSLSELRQIARRRVLYFIIPAVLVWVVGAVLAYSLPSVYQSTGVILVEAQEIPEDLVRSTVTGFAERRIQVINQRVMSSANLRRTHSACSGTNSNPRGSQTGRIRATIRRHIEHSRSNNTLIPLYSVISKNTEILRRMCFSMVFGFKLNRQKFQQLVAHLGQLAER